ncbi:MAG TPA: 1-(5-phosphoribosyl)-5-[(5-phosphoribosylamino)methylideneamino] imidazole-4-carboxamide isomerase [Bacillota bacterium]
MLVIPAIDIRGGKVVRLLRGDYEQETVYGTSPAGVAAAYVAAGASRVHLVDLDGARAGRPVNLAVLEAVARMAAPVPVQCGGGLRDEESVVAAFTAGAAMVILGSAAVKDPAWVGRLAEKWPGRILVSLDTRGGKVAVGGWLEDTGVALEDAASGLIDRGITTFIYTGIEQDGTGDGPDLAGVQTLAGLGAEVIAAGGVGRLGDLRRLDEAGAFGAIIGRALFEGRIDLRTAIAAAGGDHGPADDPRH